MSRSTRIRSLIAALCAGLLFCAVFAIQMHAPGLFMDSINPEYLAPRILDHARAGDRFVYATPGNLLADRFPVLAGSFYHGPMQLYLALPVYALLGTDLVGARVAQGMFGLAVLLAMAALLRQQRVRPVLLAAGLGLLALDPAFVQAFKTQALSTVWPLVLVFAAAWLVERRAIAGQAPGRRALLCAGALSGLAFFAYFIHLFLLPALLLHALLAARAGGLRGRGALAAPAWCLCGFVLGCVPYIAGYALMADALGWDAFVGYFGGTSQALVAPAASSASSAADLLARTWTFARAAVGDDWLAMTVFAGEGASWLDGGKWLLLGAPVALALRRPRGVAHGRRLLVVVVAAIASFLLLSLPLVGRLHGHHFVVLLPLLYLAATLATDRLATDRLATDRRATGQPAADAPARPRIDPRDDARPGDTTRDRTRRVPLAVLAGLSLVLLADNLHAQRAFLQRLEATGGAGDYTVALNALAADALRAHPRDLYLFPDWGFFMPFAFLTGGRVDYAADIPVDTLRARVLGGVCRGRAVHVVRAGNGAPDPQLDRLLAKTNGWAGAAARASLSQRRDDARRLVDGLTPVTTTHALRDGTPVFDTHRFAALPDPDAEPLCAGLAVPACRSAAVAPGATLAATPCLVDRCPAGRLAEVDIAWHAPGVAQAEVWVGARDTQKKLWTGGAGDGRATTGPWADSGAEFELRETGSGRVLATLRLGGPGCAAR